MQILEFGNKNNKKIILIHGFQSPYQVWEKYIECYKNDYHIIVPINDKFLLGITQKTQKRDKKLLNRHKKQLYQRNACSLF